MGCPSLLPVPQTDKTIAQGENDSIIFASAMMQGT